MKDYLISLYIDNELNLAEKREFVTLVNKDDELAGTALSLLDQEVLLRKHYRAADVKKETLREKLKNIRLLKPLSKPLMAIPAVMMICVIAISLYQYTNQSQELQLATAPLTEQGLEPHRFVLYDPTSTNVQIIGSFTNWQPMEMEQTGNSGYWSLTIELPQGEHRYSYLTGDGTRITDPTVWAREKDDFGGENSILNISATI